MMTEKPRFYGYLRINQLRRTNHPDPSFCGKLIIAGVELSICAWEQEAEDGEDFRMVNGRKIRADFQLRITARPWGRRVRRSKGYGQLVLRPRNGDPTAPRMAGGLTWGGRQYSLMAWANEDRGGKLLKITAEPIPDA